MNIDRINFLKQDYSHGFPAYCGFEVEHIDHGIFQARLKVRPEHKQKEGFVHAGVIATLADHTAGYSAYTIVPESKRILTIEFKINYLKPALGSELVCKSKVLSEGKRIIITESEIYDLISGKQRLVSKAIATMMAVSLDEINR
jgi:uncharacterized protein (TIGR00369 family)